MKINNSKNGTFLLSALVLIVNFFIGCHSDTQNIPRHFTSDNYLIADGKPFFPIGIYSVYPVSSHSVFEEIKVAGFNSIASYEEDENYLKQLVEMTESKGLKLLIYPGSRLEKSGFDISKVKRVAKSFRKSGTILAWYLCEEPDSSHINPQQIEEEKGIVCTLDTLHPTSIMISNPEKYRDFSNCADIFMIERYPVPKQPLVEVAECVALARKAVKDKIPVWAALQAFGYQNEKNKGWGWKREPTYDEMKAMTYLAIVRGARGIFYFTYHGSQYFIKDSPRHWENLKAIVGELRAIYPLLTAPEVKDSVINISTSGVKQSSLFWTVRQVKEGNSVIQAGNYLIGVNGTKYNVTGTFGLKNHSDGNLRVVLEKRFIPSHDGIFSDNFKPYEVHIYHLG